MFNKYRCVMQDGFYDCGVSSLMTILNTYGIDVAKEKLRKMTNTTTKGTSFYNLIEASKQLNLEAKGVEATIDSISNFLPAISQILVDNSFYHFIVIHKINKKKNTIIIADPATGLKEIDITEFKKITTSKYIIFLSSKKKKFKDKRLKKYIMNIIKNNKKTIKQILIITVLSILLSILFNIYLKVVISKINNLNFLFIISYLFLILSLFKNLFNYFKDKLYDQLSLKIDKDISLNVYKQIFLLPYKYYKSRSTGEILSIINDLGDFKDFIVKVLMVSFMDLLLIIFVSLFMLCINIWYFIFLSLMTIIYLLITYFFQDVFSSLLLNIKEKSIALSSYVVNRLDGYESIKNLNIINIVLKKIKCKYDSYEVDIKSYNKKYNLTSIIRNMVTDTFFIIIVLLSIIMINNKLISISDLILFNSLFYVFSNSLNNCFESIVIYKTYNVSINKILNLYDVSCESNCISKKVVYKRIIFKNVCFAYNENNLINKFNLEIKEGDKVLIQGPSGSGKSTLIKLLMKYYDMPKGHIFINNINHNSININELRTNITYVSQEDKLFIDTLKNNIVFDSLNLKRYERVKQLCLIDEMLLTKGINDNYILDDDSTNLSGGEKNKIIIARSLYKDSSVIIFDETFNELDLESERKILQNIINLCKDKIIVVITHRDNNKDLFNKIIKINGGVKNERINKKRTKKY